MVVAGMAFALSITRAFKGLQGYPAHTIQGGMSLVTTDLAPITQPAPIETPGCTKASAAIHTWLPISMGLVISGNPGLV